MLFNCGSQLDGRKVRSREATVLIEYVCSVQLNWNDIVTTQGGTGLNINKFLNTDKAVKSYAEATAVSQKQVLNEMSAAQTSKNVVEEVTRIMDNENVDRINRIKHKCLDEIPNNHVFTKHQ